LLIYSRRELALGTGRPTGDGQASVPPDRWETSVSFAGSVSVTRSPNFIYSLCGAAPD